MQARTQGWARCFGMGCVALLLAGCSAGMQPLCRHTALMCALVMQERYPAVDVAFGPVINADQQPDPLVMHAQTRVLVNDKWVWVTYSGGSCQLTDVKERFLDFNHYSADVFYAWLWKPPGGKGSSASLPTGITFPSLPAAN